MKHIIFFEDDKVFRARLKEMLVKHHFIVCDYGTEEEVKIAANNSRTITPHAAILDIRNGSGVDVGFDLCRLLQRRWRDLPVIFLTDYSYTSKAYKESWRHDCFYLNKTVADAPILVIDKLHVLLGKNSNIHAIGHLTIDRVTLEIWWRQRPVTLDHIPRELVRYLSDHPGRFRTPDDICHALDLRITSKTNIETPDDTIDPESSSTDDAEEDAALDQAAELEKKRGEMEALEKRRTNNLIASHIGKIRRAFRNAERDYAAEHTADPVDFETILKTGEDGQGYAWTWY